MLYLFVVNAKKKCVYTQKTLQATKFEIEVKFIMKKNLLYTLYLACMVGFRFLPPPLGMTVSGMHVLGIFTVTLILWLTVAIDWPSVLCLVALMCVPELKVNSILQASMGSVTVSFLIFTFSCTFALSRTSFVKRCAIAFISNRIACKGSWCFVSLYSLSILLIGLFMSPSVLFVIYLPIHETICNELSLSKNDKLANMLMLANLFCCAFACGMTPIAHVFPIMGLGFLESATGYVIPYASYMMMAIPVGIICFVMMLLLFWLILRPDMSKLENINLDTIRNEIKPFTLREKMIITIFFIVVAMWVLPDLLKGYSPFFALLCSKGTAFPPMTGCVAMFILSVDDEPLLIFKDAMNKGVQWGSILMATATLAIGFAITNKDIALTAWLSSTIKPVIASMSPSCIVLTFMIWAFCMTNTCSNMVTVTVVCAIAIPICLASDNSLSTTAISSMIGMAASYAFVLPSAHPNVAIAIGSGWTTTAQVITYGTVLMIIGIVTSVFVGYPLATRIM